MHIVGIKTLDGFYISEKANETYGSTYLTDYLINGEKPEKTFHVRWVKTKNEPIKIQRYKSQPNINHRFELVDESLESEKFPKVLMRDEVCYLDDEGHEWKEEFSHLRSLYEYKYDKQESVLEDLKFSYETILEMDEIKDGKGFSYPVQKTNWSHDGTINLNSSDVENRLIDKIVFPSITHSSLPSRITSEQMYKIVRQHVKQNIDLSVAKITSDHNFCFAVKKVIKLNNPYSISNEIKKNNGKSYAKPRYNTRYISTKEFEIFEMTHDKQNYSDYTPIAGIEANNIDELQERIDNYLDRLMKFINTPVKECFCCNGKGIELNDDVRKWVLNEI